MNQKRPIVLTNSYNILVNKGGKIMLDEIKEFEQYTFDLNDEKTYAAPLKKSDCRLKKTPLIKDFSGITRALTIIARYYMFNKNNSNVFNVKDVDYIKEVLRAWCGFQTKEYIPEIDGWLNLYIRKAAFYNPAKTCVEEFIKTKVTLQNQLSEYENKKVEIKKQRPKLGDKNLALAVKEKYPELIDAIIFDKLEKIFPETVLKKENNEDFPIKEKAEAIALKTTMSELEKKKEKLSEIEKEIEKNYKVTLSKLDNLKNLTTRITDVMKIIDVLIKLNNKAKYYNKSFYSSNFENKPYDLNTITLALKTTMSKLEKKKEKLSEIEKEIEKNYKVTLSKLDNLKNLTTRITDVMKIIDVLIKLNNKAKYYNKSFYSSNFKNKPYDLNTITLDRIIANAFTMGRLEQYYLVCDGNPFEAVTIKKNTAEANPQSTKPQKNNTNVIEKKLLDPRNNDKDLILKITANYLLQKRFTDQEYVVFNKTDMSNWMWKKGKADNFNLFMYKLDTGNSPNDCTAIIAKRRAPEKLESLFNLVILGADKKQGKKGTSKVKLKVHPDWIKLFRLVRIQDIMKSENKNALYFSDGCQNSYLVVNNWKGTPIFEDKEDVSRC